MKPDWQNKSYAKNGSPAGPSTTHPKLKLGMSSLHSKIAVANHNTVQSKPAVRKMADGGVVRTRSDDEIGDTNPRTGVVDPGSYDRRMKAGEENLNRLKSAVESVRNFFSREKSPETSSANITGDSGMSESDAAKKQAMSGQMPYEKKEESPAPEEKRREITDYMVKKGATSQVVSSPSAESSPLPEVLAAPAPAATVKKVKVQKTPKDTSMSAEVTNLKNRYPVPVTKSSAKSFAEDVAQRKGAATSTDTTLYSDTIKPSTKPADKTKQRIHPRTGKPY